VLRRSRPLHRRRRHTVRCRQTRFRARGFYPSRPGNTMAHSVWATGSALAGCQRPRYRLRRGGLGRRRTMPPRGVYPTLRVVDEVVLAELRHFPDVLLGLPSTRSAKGQVPESRRFREIVDTYRYMKRRTEEVLISRSEYSHGVGVLQPCAIETSPMTRRPSRQPVITTRTRALAVEQRSTQSVHE
jgi:hypothetical protein